MTSNFQRKEKMINITLPDGSVRQLEKGASAMDVALSLLLAGGGCILSDAISPSTMMPITLRGQSPLKNTLNGCPAESTIISP